MTTSTPQQCRHTRFKYDNLTFVIVEQPQQFKTYWLITNIYIFKSPKIDEYINNLPDPDAYLCFIDVNPAYDFETAGREADYAPIWYYEIFNQTFEKIKQQFSTEKFTPLRYKL